MDSAHALLGSAPVVQNLDLWHRRLNHFNKRSICRAVNENLISVGEILDRLQLLSLVEEVDGIARCIIH